MGRRGRQDGVCAVFDHEAGVWDYADAYNDGRKDGQKPARVYRVTHPAMDDRLYVVHWDAQSAIGAVAERLKVSAVLWGRHAGADPLGGKDLVDSVRRLIGCHDIPDALRREILNFARTSLEKGNGQYETQRIPGISDAGAAARPRSCDSTADSR